MRFLTVGTLLCLPMVAAVACGSSDEDPGSKKGGGGGTAGDSGGSGGKGGKGGKGGSAGSSRGGGSPGGEAGDSGAGGNSSGGSSRGGGPQGGAGAASGAGGEGGGDPCAACSSHVCLGDGTCVECREEQHCSGAKPHCDTDSNVCVVCLPSDDDCPTGEYCASSFTCVPGCNSGTGCASGSCLSTHDCDHCIRDSECVDGRVCANGTCSAACTGEAQSCGTSKTCCGAHCVDTTRDITHCGGCASVSASNTCGASAFCGTMGCTAAVVAAICQNAGAVLMRDGLAPNTAAGTVLGNALGACSPAPTVRSVEQNVLDVSNPTTGQPVVGPGELLVLTGGAYGQLVANYFQNETIAALKQVAVGGSYEIHRSADDSRVAGCLQTEANPTHDIFLFQVVRDPDTGTLAFNVAGFNQSGTAAGAWYFQNVTMPSLSTFTKSWYVYEWTDGGGNQLPDGSDTFTRLAEAP